MVVLLPAPLGPSRPKTEDAGTLIDRASTATSEPNRRVRRSVMTAGGRPSCSANDPGLLSKQAVQDGERVGHLPQVHRRRPGQPHRDLPPRLAAQAGGKPSPRPREGQRPPGPLPPVPYACPPTAPPPPV